MQQTYIDVLFGHRKEAYDGEFAPEALAVADQGTQEENPDYMAEQLDAAKKDTSWNALAVVRVLVDQKQLQKALYPTRVIQGSIAGNSEGNSDPIKVEVLNDPSRATELSFVYKKAYQDATVIRAGSVVAVVKEGKLVEIEKRFGEPSDAEVKAIRDWMDASLLPVSCANGHGVDAVTVSYNGPAVLVTCSVCRPCAVSALRLDGDRYAAISEWNDKHKNMRRFARSLKI